MSSHHLPPPTPSPNTDSNATGLVFFPQPDRAREEEEDYFAAPARVPPRSGTHRGVIDHPSQTFAWNSRRLSFGGRLPFSLDAEINIGLGLGLGGIERLPDEPQYPPSVPLVNQYKPQETEMPRTASLQTLAMSDHEASEPTKKPFGHSFLAPSPTIISIRDSDTSISKIKRQLTPLIPVGFVSPPRPSNQPPPSPDGQSASTKRSLGPTDSSTLYPSLSRPKQLGHARRDSGDSQRTVRPGDGLVPLLQSAKQAATCSSSASSSPLDAPFWDASIPTDKKGCNYGDSEHVKYSNEGTYVPPRRPATSRFASQGSGLPLKPRAKQESRLRSHSVSAPFVGAGNRTANTIRGRPSSSAISRPSCPLSRQLYAGDRRGSLHTLSPYCPHPDGEGLVHFPFPPAENIIRPISPASASRFKRPVSPSLPPEDTSSWPQCFGHGEHTHTHSHQTLSSAPKRPKSPTTAQESLRVVLARNTEAAEKAGAEADDDEDDDRSDSLDRLVRVAQRAEYGSLPLYQPHPPSPLSLYRKPLSLPPPMVKLSVGSVPPVNCYQHQYLLHQRVNGHSPQMRRGEYTSPSIANVREPSMYHHNGDEDATVMPVGPRPRKGFTLSSFFPPSPPLSHGQKHKHLSPSPRGQCRPIATTPPTNDDDFLPTPPETSRVSPAADLTTARFDVDKITETLRTNKGRVSFAELEGMSHPSNADTLSLVNDHRDDDDDDDRESSGGMIAATSGRAPVPSSTIQKGRHQHRRPGSSSRRWTLPF
ncbi:hypothetical protein I317_00632 [Kwoniella heveanensis CBS 569]|nr:hypothetical protein I317_00632 [Kwoniella heveanensis CBS 569]